MCLLTIFSILNGNQARWARVKQVFTMVYRVHPLVKYLINAFSKANNKNFENKLEAGSLIYCIFCMRELLPKPLIKIKVKK